MGPSEDVHRLFVGVWRWNEAIHCKIAPGGQAKAVFDIGSVPRIMRVLGEGSDLDAPELAITGMTVGQTLKNVKRNRDQAVVCRIAHPISAAGEVVGLQGSGVPEGAIVKVAGMTRLPFRRPARVFDREEDCFRAVESRADTDGEAAGGGPVGLGRDGQTIAIDPEEETHDVKVSEAELATGHKAWEANPYQSGTLRKYANRVGLDRTGEGRARRQQSGSYMPCG